MKKIVLMAVILIQSLGLTTKESIDCCKYKDKLLINAKINTKRGFLLVDTGSDLSLIDKNTAKKYRFKIGSKYKAMRGIAGGERWSYNVEFLSIRSKGVTIDADFKAVNLSGVLREIGVVGIIGADWLNKNGVVIDYKKSKIWQ